MKKLILLISLLGVVFASPWISRENHINSDDYETYCHNGSAYYIFGYRVKTAIMAPAYYEGLPVRCKVITTHYHTFTSDDNVVEFFIIKNGRKIIINP